MPVVLWRKSGTSRYVGTEKNVMTVSRLQYVPAIGVDRMGDAADAAADPEILRLENMDTDIPPPQHVIEVTRAAVGRDDCNSYLPFMGQDALRQAAAAHVTRMSGVSYDWKRQCIISAGGCSGILNTFLALLETAFFNPSRSSRHPSESGTSGTNFGTPPASRTRFRSPT